MIICKELDTSFSTSKELFAALKANKDYLISKKKSEIYESRNKGTAVKARPIDGGKIYGSNKGLFDDDRYYYIVVNTTKILDSHRDLHVNGIWNKTAKERNRKNYLVDTHVMSLNTTIARKENVEIFVSEISFKVLGFKYEGDTEALVYKIPKDKIISPLAKEWLESGDDLEASVSMQYVKIDLAMNSEALEDKEEKKIYLNNIESIANKTEIESSQGEINYFWVVREAKNAPESSLVLQASNPVTGVYNNSEKQEPSKDTQKQEPSNDTRLIEHIKSRKFI